MKLTIEQEMSCHDPEIIIRCGLMDARLKRLVELVRLYSFSVTAQRDGMTRQIALEEIYYFESVDNKTFLYMAREIYGCEHKLYELEEQLSGTPFVRVSKNCIVNTGMVSGVQALLNGRLEATLQNGEKLLVSKHYVKAFRAKFES